MNGCLEQVCGRQRTAPPQQVVAGGYQLLDGEKRREFEPDADRGRDGKPLDTDYLLAPYGMLVPADAARADGAGWGRNADVEQLIR
jgi:hypothetical protein